MKEMITIEASGTIGRTGRTGHKRITKPNSKEVIGRLQFRGVVSELINEKTRYTATTHGLWIAQGDSYSSRLAHLGLLEPTPSPPPRMRILGGRNGLLIE